VTAAVPPARRSGRATLATCGATHALHDGFGDGMLLFLPLWQAEMGLTLAQTGALRAMYSIASAALQLPGSFLGERIGARTVLAAGTALLGLGYICGSFSGGYAFLAAAILLTGTGASVQHALSSSLISHATEGPRLRVALGTYNFLGDVGKVAVPAAAAFAVSAWSWRGAMGGLGLAGIAFAAAIFFLLRNGDAHAAAAAGTERRGAGGASHWPRFSLLAAISFTDSLGRYGVLTLLPFVLIAKGADIATVGLGLSLVFAGGAAGKFACGLIAIRLGAVGTVLATETFTAAAILALGALPLSVALPLLPLLGLTLNGTSSVLYGSVPETVARDKVARAFGLFYTLVSAGTAVAPFLYGHLADRLGLDRALYILAAAALAVLPMALSLKLVKPRG
jgi:MFS family permease